MPKTIRVLAADDAHLEFLKMNFFSIAKERKDSDQNIYEIVETAENGLELIEKYEQLISRNSRPDLITLDIEMPKADGLWALHELSVRYRPHPPIVMVSSLDGDEVQRKYKESISKFQEQSESVPEEKKRELIARVADRIRDGAIEAGKVNTLVDAGLRLGFNPINLSRFLGARGFVVKPYKSTRQVTSVLDPALTGGNGEFYKGVAD